MNISLCSVCRTIPFEDILGPDSETYRGPNSWALGCFADVRARSCRFCELVAPICFDRVSSYAKDPPKDTELISVHCVGSYGFSTNCSPVGTYIGVAGRYEETSVLCMKTPFPEWIDVDGIKEWIAACDSQHSNSCAQRHVYSPALFPRNSKQQLDLRLIDTHAMCVVYAQRGCEYIALSYVWGSRDRDRLILTSDNEETLMHPRSLSQSFAQDSLPQTIKDAITVTQLIGQRYLWVDSLCLLQDDEEELDASIAIMDLFYEMATLTIIAASGDAWHGLPGIKPTPRKFEPMVRSIRSDLRLCVIPDLPMKLRGSLYSCRAWTMQEEVLSNRLIVFVGGQVLFQCGTGSYGEGITRQTRNRPHSRPGGGSSMYDFIFKSGQMDFSIFPYIVMYYMGRELSFSNDVLRAAQGLLRSFAIQSGVQCFEGLPGPLDRSLLFRTDVEPPSRMFGRRTGFPSYSWTGWRSCPHYDDQLEDMTEGHEATNARASKSTSSVRCTWILWFSMREDGKVSRIDSSGRLRKSLPPTFQVGQSRAPASLRQLRASISDTDYFSIKPTRYPLLLFWTICVNLDLQAHPRSKRPSSQVQLIGRKEAPCGAVTLDEEVYEATPMKFALIATTQGAYWAIALKWEDGIAERYGMAKLSENVLRDCLEPGPRWRQIVLG